MSKKSRTLVAPSPGTLDRYLFQDIFRAKAKQALAGMDVTSRTPEVEAILEKALAETETAVGASFVEATKESMFSSAFDDIQWDAKQELNSDSGPEFL